MRYHEKKTFFVYSIGSSLDELCLGHMVLRNYARPLTVHHCKHPRLSDDELKEHAHITPLAPNFGLKHVSGFNVSPGIDAADIVTLKFLSTSKKGYVLTASAGHRIVLKDPVQFFVHKILSNEEATKILFKWLLAYQESWRITRAPKIWFLTGLYTLKDGTYTEIDDFRLGTEVGLSPALTQLAAGLPVGPSLKTGVVSRTEITVPTIGEAVWAARYQQLNVKDTLKTINTGQNHLPPYITLHATSFSKGETNVKASIPLMPILAGPVMAGLNDRESESSFYKDDDTFATLEFGEYLTDDEEVEGEEVVAAPEDPLDDDALLEEEIDYTEARPQPRFKNFLYHGKFLTT